MHDASLTSAPFVPVIPAGGAGSRLWPLSRRDHPKFLLDLTGSGRSLLQTTLARVAPLADRPPLIVTGSAHAAAVREQAGAGARVLVEPSPRSSMPAIALAAAAALREDEDAVIGSFAADHLIADEAAFGAAVRAACEAAREDVLVTIGITPDHPATGFGYIEPRAGAPLAAEAATPVSRFVEKPEGPVAQQLVDAGARWNAGMFIARARFLLDSLAEQIPPLAAGVQEIAAAYGTAQEEQISRRVWPTLLSIAIDHALAEPLAAAGRVAMVPAAMGWADIGDFATLASVVREGGHGQLVDAERTGTERTGTEHTGATRTASGREVVSVGDGETVAVDSQATVYGSSGRLVALVGVQGLSIVDTPDALLVVADDRAQDVSVLGALIEEAGLPALR